MGLESFDGKVAVITGGASGIGLALARRLATAGARLVLADIEVDALDRAVGELTSSGTEVIGVRADVAERAQVEAVAARAMERIGALHLAVNNAGVGLGGPCWTLTEDDSRWVLGVNLWGVIHGVSVFTPLIISSGGGHVVNTASMAGLTSTPFVAPYNVAKHGVVALSETLALELAMLHPEVGVTVVCPG
jgi:NAD(P)-dependent dehydrogenase (short-subunit alcohol dehydrogenase family)